MDCQGEDDNTINHYADKELQQERQERCPPDRYSKWVYIAQEEDPVTVKEAPSSHHAAKWRKAMETELQSLHKNQLWELSELPLGKKAIGSINVERYKARLVAQSYNQKYGTDYDETFCLLVTFESVLTLIALKSS